MIISFVKLAYTISKLVVGLEVKKVRVYKFQPTRFKPADMRNKTLKFCAKVHRGLRAARSSREFTCISSLFARRAPGFTDKLPKAQFELLTRRLKQLSAQIPSYPSPVQFTLKNFRVDFDNANVISFTLSLLKLIFLSTECTHLCKLFGYACCSKSVSLDSGRESYSTSHTDKSICEEKWAKYYDHLQKCFEEFTDPVAYQQATTEGEMDEVDQRHDNEIDVGNQEINLNDVIQDQGNQGINDFVLQVNGILGEDQQSFDWNEEVDGYFNLE